MEQHDILYSKPSFLDDDFFQSLSDKERSMFALEVLSFLKYDVIREPGASLLYYSEIVQLSPVRAFKYKKINLFYPSIRFTSKGLGVTQDLLTAMGLSVEELESLEDIFEIRLANADFKQKFVMHDRRLSKELQMAPDRVKSLNAIYAMKFEDELKPHLRG